MKKFILVCSLLLLLFLPSNSSAVYELMGDFALGESFMSEVITYEDGTRATVAIVFRGASPTTLMLFISSSPETLHLLSPGYCYVDKTQGAAYWFFDFGLGTRDVTFRIQKQSNNKIRVWRE